VKTWVGSTASELISWTLSMTSRKLRSVSMRVRSTPDMISLMTLCRGAAPGRLSRRFRYGSSSPLTKPKSAPNEPFWSAIRFAPSGAAQSRQR
jgi:hypothetical protein